LTQGQARLISGRVTAVPTPFDHYRSGDFHAAEEAARAALAAGDDARLRQLLGVLLCRRGNLEEGAEELGRALEAAPANATLRLGYFRALIDLYIIHILSSRQK
jgi:tetratricopeptide (TPR) repeat protein